MGPVALKVQTLNPPSPVGLLSTVLPGLLFCDPFGFCSFIWTVLRFSGIVVQVSPGCGESTSSWLLFLPKLRETWKCLSGFPPGHFPPRPRQCSLGRLHHCCRDRALNQAPARSCENKPTQAWSWVHSGAKQEGGVLGVFQRSHDFVALHFSRC